MASPVAQEVKKLPAMQETRVWVLAQEAPLEKEMQPIPVFLHGESMDRGAWWTIVHGDVESHNTAERLKLSLSIL